MAISRKPISIKDVAFRTSFGLGPEKTENQGPNRERKAGGWGESMVRRGALERCETGATPLETRGKRKPVTPENDPRETGLSFLNGGGGGNRTRVPKRFVGCFYVCSVALGWPTQPRSPTSLDNTKKIRASHACYLVRHAHGPALRPRWQTSLTWLPRIKTLRRRLDQRGCCD